MSMEGSTLAVGGRQGSTAPLRVLGDEALMRRAARGSEAAFSVIFDRHHQALYRYAMTIVGNREDAFDTVQNAFVSLLRSLPGEKREIKLKPWLFRIVHNEAISLIRQRGTTSTELSEEPSVDESPEDRMLAQAIIADLSTLGAQQRSAVAMRELNGLSHAEIGDALGVSEAAAKQAVYEGRVALQQIAEGREMSCSEVQRSLSANDRRLMKGRKVRSHLRACSVCRAFADSISERRVGLAAISPLPVVLSGKLLAGVLGGGGGPAGGLMVGAGAGAAGAGAAQSFGIATLAKVGISAALVIGGGVAIERGVEDAGDASAENGTPPALAGHPAEGSDVSFAGNRSERFAHRDLASGRSSGHPDHGVAGISASGGPRGNGNGGNGNYGGGGGSLLNGSGARGPNGITGSGGEHALQGPKGSGIGSSVGGGGNGGSPSGGGGGSGDGGGSTDDGGTDAPPVETPPTEVKDPPPHGNGPAHGQAIAASHDPGHPGNSAGHSQSPEDPPGLQVPHVPHGPPAPNPGDVVGHNGNNGNHGSK
jgi:RNA polymerase sigma factor (sigma-70 family)